jgi:hypothetical protein
MERSRRHPRTWLAAALALAGLACTAGLWITPAGLGPQHSLAQARWQAQGIRHYRMTARLTESWIRSGPWTVEIRDERVVAGHDTASGEPLNDVELRVAQRFLPITTLFAALGKELRLPVASRPRTALARLLPPLHDTLDRCATRMPLVDYHPTLGYPSGVTAYTSPCYPGSNWTVLVLELTPLP